MEMGKIRDRVAGGLNVAMLAFLNVAEDQTEDLPERVTRVCGTISWLFYMATGFVRGDGWARVEDEIEAWADRIRERDQWRGAEIEARGQLQERRLSKLEQHRRHLSRKSNGRQSSPELVAA